MKILFLLAAVAVAAPACGAVVLDQDNFITIQQPGYQLVQAVGGLADRRQAQVIKAGKSGLLTRVDFQVASIQRSNQPQNVLKVEILAGGAGNLPTGAGPNAFSVASAALPTIGAVNQDNYLSLDVSSLGFQVTRGYDFKVYFYAQNLNNGSRFALLYGEQVGEDADGNAIVGSFRTYLPGANHITDNTGNLPWQETIYDRGFRTYVATVPEPASWAMLIAGFGLVGAAARRRRVVAA
nr:PEPxxWA-CTERM sorting domain-containing protein [Polymorphobacter sp.]